MHAVLPSDAKNGGSIINISYIAAKVGLSDRFAYSMSKGAVHAMSMSVAKDYINDNIDESQYLQEECIPLRRWIFKKELSGQETEMFDKLSKTQPIGRMGKPIEVAHQVLYLCNRKQGLLQAVILVLTEVLSIK
jgi:NAD(P)-dependent dehydrogenase (short-subunit alcohol dehydrogenase family)